MNKDNKNCPGPKGQHCMTTTFKRDLSELCKDCPSRERIETEISAQRQHLKEVQKDRNKAGIKTYKEDAIKKLSEMLEHNIKTARMELRDEFKSWGNLTLRHIALREQIKFLSNYPTTSNKKKKSFTLLSQTLAIVYRNEAGIEDPPAYNLGEFIKLDGNQNRGRRFLKMRKKEERTVKLIEEALEILHQKTVVNMKAIKIAENDLQTKRTK